MDDLYRIESMHITHWGHDEFEFHRIIRREMVISDSWGREFISIGFHTIGTRHFVYVTLNLNSRSVINRGANMEIMTG